MPQATKAIGKLTRVRKLSKLIIRVFQKNELPKFKSNDQQKAYNEILTDHMDLYTGCRFMKTHCPLGGDYRLYISDRLSQMSLKDLKHIAKTYIEGLEDCENKTYYKKHIAYRLIAVQKGKEGWNGTLKKNWYDFCNKSASEIDDISGRNYGTGKTRKYVTKLDKRNKKIMANKKKIDQKETKAVKNTKKAEDKPVKKSKTKQYDEPKRGRPAKGEKTLSGEIIKALSKGRGMTREELLEHLKDVFPTRDPEVMNRSLTVYMSTFKKKFEVTVDSKGREKLTPLEESEEKPAKKAKKDEEKPAKKAKKASKDEDVEEDEEEEEAPKKKSKKNKKDKVKVKKSKKASKDESEDDED